MQAHAKSIASGGLGLVAFAASALGPPRTLAWLLFAIGIFLIVASGLFWLGEGKTRIAPVPAATPRPSLAFVPPRVEENVPMLSGGTRTFVFGGVRNDQSTPGQGATAKSAHLTVTYTDSRDGEVLAGPFRGRWRDAPSPLQQSPLQLHTDSFELDLRANGAVREFDVAMRTEESGQLFGIDAAQRGHPFVTGHILATFELKGENFEPVTHRYKVRNHPGGLTAEDEPT